MSMDQRQIELEWELMQRFRAAVQTMELAITAVNENSDVVKVDMQAWANFVHDELPSSLHWDERVNEKAASDKPYLKAVRS